MFNWIGDKIDEYVEKKAEEQRSEIDKAFKESFNKAKSRIDSEFSSLGVTLSQDMQNKLLDIAQTKARAIIKELNNSANSTMLNDIVCKLVNQELDDRVQSGLSESIEKIKEQKKASLIKESVKTYPIVIFDLNSLQSYTEIHCNRFLSQSTRKFTFGRKFERELDELKQKVLQYSKHCAIAKAMVESQKFSGVDAIFVKNIDQMVTNYKYQERMARLSYYTTIDVIFLSVSGESNLCAYQDIVDPIEILGGELGI